MCASWNVDYDKALLVDLLEQIRIPEEGKASIEGIAFTMFASVLHSAIVFSKEVPETEQVRIVDQALFLAARRGPIKPQSLMREISLLEKVFLEKPLHRFILLTSISIPYEPILRPIRLRDGTITFSQQVPKAFKRSEAINHYIIREHFGSGIPDGHTVVCVFVSARTTDEAMFRGLDTLDFLRGIWNFSHNHSTFLRSSFSVPNPVNRLTLGPIHTLHFDNGELASEQPWYELDYTVLRTAERVDWSKLKRDEKAFRQRIKKHNYGQQIEYALIRYCRALDSRDLHVAFIRLWGILEFLTCKDTSKEIARRVSFLYRDSTFIREMLRHLATFRNRTVHAGYTSQDVEERLYQLKQLVERLLLFHTFNKFGFKSLYEAADFLDLPQDVEESKKVVKELKRKIKLYEQSVKYRSRFE